METLTAFSVLPLPVTVLEGLAAQGLDTPTPIQAQAIPHILAGHDLLGLAHAGTGKTLAFCLPLITQLEQNQESAALVLAPTREVAVQIVRVFKRLTESLGESWRPLLLAGSGERRMPAEKSEFPRRLIVATPARLLEEIQAGEVSLEKVQFLIFDNLDRLITLGFKEQVLELMGKLPDLKQSVFFTSAFNDEVETLCSQYLKKPTRLEVGWGNDNPLKNVQQSLMEVAEDTKFYALTQLLQVHEGQTLIFTRTKWRTEKLARNLERKGIASGRIHGDRSQGQRMATLSAFKEGKVKILILTDIAARGMDIPDVAHVFSYDIPSIPEEYIYRLRFMKQGQAISLLAAEEESLWEGINKMLTTEAIELTKLVAPEKPETPEPAPQEAKKEQAPREPRRPNQNRHERNGRHGRNKNRDHHRPQEQQPHYNNGNYAAPAERTYSDDDEDEYFPQPSLEEQMSRLNKQVQQRMRMPKEDPERARQMQMAREQMRLEMNDQEDGDDLGNRIGGGNSQGPARRFKRRGGRGR